MADFWLIFGSFAADMSIPVGRMEINEVEKLNRLTFGTVGRSNDQSLPALTDLHLDSDDESQDPGEQQHLLAVDV